MSIGKVLQANIKKEEKHRTDSKIYECKKVRH